MVVKENLESIQEMVGGGCLDIEGRLYSLAEELKQYGFTGNASVTLTVTVSGSMGATLVREIRIPFDRT